ncbi:MAG: acyl-CoA thioesterase [Cyclobacteriaceae bacterium]|nr:acyl-CoA thioesterase [Cyclobacteriaceae bacterium]
MLSHKIEIPVRFNEADPLGIVWHGHYVRYFEDSREAFGKTYGISYLDFYSHNLVVPIVSIQCDYKKPLRYGDTIIVSAVYKPCVAAKLIFEYEIFDAGKNELVATGTSTQVFVDAKTFQLQLVTPEFFQRWKEKMNLE